MIEKKVLGAVGPMPVNDMGPSGGAGVGAETANHLPPVAATPQPTPAPLEAAKKPPAPAQPPPPPAKKTVVAAADPESDDDNLDEVSCADFVVRLTLCGR